MAGGKEGEPEEEEEAGAKPAFGKRLGGLPAEVGNQCWGGGVAGSSWVCLNGRGGCPGVGRLLWVLWGLRRPWVPTASGGFYSSPASPARLLPRQP